MAVTIGGEGLSFVADLNVNPFETEAKRLVQIMQGQASRISQTVAQQSAQMESLAQKASTVIGGYLSLQAAGSFIKDIVEVRGQFQQLGVAFETFLGSKEKADKLMAQAVQLAAVTPFTLQDVGTGAKQLLAYGFAADTVIDNLEKLGNIAAGVGAPLNDIVYTYGTLKAQGRAYAQDIRQFTGRGIPIIAELAKQFHTTADGVSDLVTKGKVGFPEIEKAINSMTGAGGLFFNLMQEQSKTLTGQLSNLQDAWSRMLNEIGKSNQGLFHDALAGAINLVNNYQQVVDVLKLIVIAYGSYRAALLLTIIQERIQQEMQLQNALGGGALTRSMQLQAAAVRTLQGAYKGLTATIASAAPVAVIAALAAVIYSLTQTVNAAAKSEENLQDIQAEGIKAYITEKGKVDDLLKVLKDKNISHNEQINTLKKLREQTGDYLKAFTDEQILAGKATGALDLYIESVKNLGFAKAAASKKSLLEGDLVDLEIKGVKAVDTFEKLGESIKALFGAGKYNKVGYFDQLIYGDKSDQAIVAKKKEDIKKQIADIDAFIKNETTASLKKNPQNPKDITGSIRSLKVIQDAIAAKKEEQLTNSANQQQYLKYQTEINKLEAEARAIAGESKADKTKENEILEKRKNILDDIAALQRDSKQSGLVKEQSEIDKTNEKYENLFKTIGEFNKAHPNNKIGQSIISALTKAQVEQVANISSKDQAEKYKQGIEAQKVYFDQFQDYQKQQLGGKAADVYQTELHGFKTYLDFLKAELDKFSGRTDVGAEQSKIFLSKAIVDEQNKNIQDSFKLQVENYQKLLEATKTFNTEKLAINKKYDDLEATLANQPYLKPEDYHNKKILLEDQRKQELTDLEDNNAAQGELYKTLNENIIRYTKEQLKERLELLKKYLADGYIIEKDGSKTILTPKMKADLLAGIEQGDELTKTFNRTFDILKKIGELGDVFSSLGDTLGSGLLKDAGAAISGITSQLGNLQIALSKSKAVTKEQKADSAISSATSLIDLVVSSAAKRKQAEKEYYAAVIGGQYEYNLALNDQIRLQHELSKNVFYNDYKAKIVDGIKAAEDAVTNYQKALAKLSEGKAKVGQKNGVDFGAVGQAAAAGAVIGAAIGAGVGAAVGAVAGAIVGLFAAKKKKDIFTALLGQYPDLVKKAADGTEKFNEELAKSLVTNNLVDDATKGILNNIIDWSKKLEEARAQIKSVVSDLAGSLGDDLRNSLVDAFKNGTDAAVAFGESVNKTLENIISNFLFNQVFAKSFDELQKRMEKSFDVGGDNNFVDDITAFYKQAPGLTKQFNDALAAAQKESEKYGLNVFGKNKNATNSNTNSLQGSIKAQLTEDTGTLIAGQFGAMRLTALEQLKVSGQHLNALNAIQANTAYLVTYLPSMDRSINDIKMNGIKIKP